MYALSRRSRMPAVNSLTVRMTRRPKGRSWTAGSAASVSGASGSSSNGRSNSELIEVLCRIADALNRHRLAGGLGCSNEDAVQARVAGGRLHADGHAAEKLVDHDRLFHADHAVVGPGHARVCEVGG